MLRTSPPIPLAQTGTLYRGVAGESFERDRGWGETGIYYPSRQLSSRTRGQFAFDNVFSAIPVGTGISSTFTISSLEAVDSACNFAAVHGGFLRDFPWVDSWPDHTGDGGDPPIGSGFFGSTKNGDSWVRTPEEVSDHVSRSGDFKAGSSPVSLTRYLGRTGNVVAWLNTFPYDTVLNTSPDVLVLSELVRSSNGTVLWADTISVRGMSTDEISDQLSVPVGTYAVLDEGVYIRIRPVVTLDVAYGLSSGYYVL